MKKWYELQKNGLNQTRCHQMVRTIFLLHVILLFSLVKALS